MNKRKSRTQEFLEAEVRFKHNGKIDLEKLWAKEDVELDSTKVRQLNNEANQG